MTASAWPIAQPMKSVADVAATIVRGMGEYRWFALVVGPGQGAEALRELIAEIKAQVDVPIIECVASDGPASIQAARRSAGLVIVTAVDDYSEEDWRHLDMLRSQLNRPDPILFVLSRQAIETAMRAAPHLAPFLNGSTFQMDTSEGELSTRERERQLQLLRDQTGWTDQQVQARAEAGTLPPEPEFAEWLLLLGRGDLIGGR